MSMIALQTVIARLCVDAPFRGAFEEDPERALQPLDLTPAEAQKLRALDREALHAYADALMAKRLSLPKKWFPISLRGLEIHLSAAVLLDRLHHYGLTTRRGPREIGGDWVRAESERFGQYLAQTAERWAPEAPYLGTVIEFERRKLALLNDPVPEQGPSPGSEAGCVGAFIGDPTFPARVRPRLGPQAVVCAFPYNLAKLMAWVEGRPDPGPPQEEPTGVLLFRPPGALSVHIRTINPALRDLLALCDGTRALAQILAVTAPRYAPAWGLTEEETVGECLTILRRLHAEGIITLGFTNI